MMTTRVNGLTINNTEKTAINIYKTRNNQDIRSLKSNALLSQTTHHFSK